MNSMGRILTWLLVILLLTSLLVLTITPVNVQAVSKPSVPQYSIKLIDNSYDVPLTQTIDQYTGTTTTHSSYREDNRTIEITIKNQPFTPYTNTSGYKIDLSFYVEVRGHFGEQKDWRAFGYIGHVVQSDSGYTVVSETISSNNGRRIPVGSQIDFRVKAVIGHMYNANRDSIFAPIWWDVYVDASSGWNTQTFTPPNDSSSTPSQTSNPPSAPFATSDNNQPQIPEQTQPPSFVFHPSFLLWISVILFVGVTVTVVLMFLRRCLKTPDYNNPSHNQ